METLNEFANWVGFGHFKGMCLYFGWMLLWVLLGLGFYYGNRPIKDKWVYLCYTLLLCVLMHSNTVYQHITK